MFVYGIALRKKKNDLKPVRNIYIKTITCKIVKIQMLMR